MSGFGNMGGKEIRLGRPFGIPLILNAWLGLLVAGIFGWALLRKQPLEGAWIVILFVSILLHEWAHALTAKAAGDTVYKVILHLFGGATLRAGRGGPKWDFRITAAGPLVNVLLGGAAYAALHFASTELPWWAVVLLSQTVWINIILAVFNLLPIHPMDGGRLARIALSKRVGAGPGARISVGLSFLTLAGVGVFLIARGQFDIIAIVILGQLFMMNVFEARQVGAPSMEETRTVLGQWWRDRAMRAGMRRAERAADRAAKKTDGGLEPSPFRRDESRSGHPEANAAARDRLVLRDGRQVLEKAVDRGIGALSPDERRLLLLHRRLIEIRVDTATGEPDKEDLRLLEMHVRLGASGQVH
jgi:Zn-dependent protease